MSTTTTLQKARQLYQDADAAGKILLERLYPKAKLVTKQKAAPSTFPAILKAFLKMKFTDTYYKQLQKRKPSDLSAIDRLSIRAEIMRKQKNWKADYKNGDQEKHFPIFEYKDDVSGFVFSFAVYGRRTADTNGGARLAMPSSQLAEQFAKSAPKDWNEFLTIN